MSMILLNISNFLINNIFGGRMNVFRRVLREDGAADGTTEEPSTTPDTTPEDPIVTNAKNIHEILTTIVGPILILISSIAIIFMIILGVQIAKSESDEKRAENKKRIVNLSIALTVLVITIAIIYLVPWKEAILNMYGYVPENAVA